MLFTYLLVYITVVVISLKIISWDVNMPNSIYYGDIIFVAIVMVAFSARKIKYVREVSLFILMAFFSIILNVFSLSTGALLRLFSFLGLLVAVGPLLQSGHALRFKIVLFSVLNKLFVAITLITFGGYLLGITSFYGAKGFCGVTKHSMLLGPIAGFSALICLYFFLKNKGNKKQKMIYLCMCIISILVCLLAASRSAFGALVVSLMCFMTCVYRKRIAKFIWILFVMFIMLTSTYPLWQTYTENILQKQEQREKVGSLLAGRDLMWVDRINDFLSSPIYGVGFASVKNIQNTKIDDSGSLEPGSSWLFILSTMGILGLCIFLYVLIIPMYTIYKRLYFDNLCVLYLALLVFFCIHMLVEGYVISSGSTSCLYLWLVLSLAYNKKNEYLKRGEMSSLNHFQI